MKLQQTIALVALLTAIIASLLFAPLSQARIAPGNPGFEGDRIMIVKVQNADPSLIQFFQTLMNIYFAPLADYVNNPLNAESNNNSKIGHPNPIRLCGGENGCIRADKP